MGTEDYPELEVVQPKFIKRLLALPLSAPNNAERSLTGRTTIACQRKGRLFHFSTKMLLANEGTPLREAYEMSRRLGQNGDKNWTTTMRDMLASHGMLWIAQDPATARNAEQRFKQRCKDMETQTWREQLQHTSRTEFLTAIDLNFEMQGFFRESMDNRWRQVLTRLLCSSHQLQIQRGRESKQPKEERLCPICTTEAEMEEHFVFRCPSYDRTRGAEHPQSCQQFRSLLISKPKEAAQLIFSLTKTREIFLARLLIHAE